MSGITAHPHHHHHHSVYWYILVVLLVSIAVIGGILVTPYLTVSRTTNIPVTGNQNSYSEYLLGEKNYAMPIFAGEALTTYHLGEKALDAMMINSSEELTIHHIGEKHVMSSLEYALLMQCMGEKDY